MASCQVFQSIAAKTRACLRLAVFLSHMFGILGVNPWFCLEISILRQTKHPNFGQIMIYLMMGYRGTIFTIETMLQLESSSGLTPCHILPRSNRRKAGSQTSCNPCVIPRRSAAQGAASEGSSWLRKPPWHGQVSWNQPYIPIHSFFLELEKYHVIYVAIKNEWDVITHKVGITCTANLHAIRNQAVEEDPFPAGICG